MKKFTVEIIEGRLSMIKAHSNDPEAAHSLEDDLFVSTLLAIAKGSDNPKELAKAALKSTKIKFPRWYS